MTTDDLTTDRVELDERTCDGVDVRLFWDPATGTVSVSVFDVKREQAFELAVASERALDAFRHPFAYAAFQGLAPAA